MGCFSMCVKGIVGSSYRNRKPYEQTSIMQCHKVSTAYSTWCSSPSSSTIRMKVSLSLTRQGTAFFLKMTRSHRLLHIHVVFFLFSLCHIARTMLSWPQRTPPLASGNGHHARWRWEWTIRPFHRRRTQKPRQGWIFCADHLFLDAKSKRNTAEVESF